MKTKKKNKKSLISDCLIFFTISTLLVSLVYIAMNFFVSSNLENSFLVIDDILVYETELAQDDFSAIPLKKFKHANFVVYDENHNLLYTTDQEINKIIDESKLDLLSSYCNESYFEVNKFYTEKEEERYFVTKKNMDEESDYEIIKRYAVLDADLNIIDGNLFSKRKYLTEEEFSLLQGRFSDFSDIEKYVYENELGQERTLVFISDMLNIDTYNSVISENNYLWLYIIPIIIILIAIEAYLFVRKIRNQLAPLNNAMENYELTNKMELNEDEVPYEFKSVVKNLKELVTHLEKVNTEKENIYKERNRVISNISHDLKTPLTVIQGYAKAFIDDLVPENKEKKYMEAIYSKTSSTADILDSLFEYTKLEHPDYKMNKSTVNICEFIKEYLANKYNEIEVEGFKLDFKIPESEELYCIDKNLIYRLFNNIVNNSIKYNKKGTTIYFNVKLQKDKIKITIADNGIGIEKKNVKNVLDAFVMGDSSRNTNNSTGLGLSIAKRIVALHDGKISIIYPPKAPYKTQIDIIISKKDA